MFLMCETCPWIFNMGLCRVGRSKVSISAGRYVRWPIWVVAGSCSKDFVHNLCYVLCTDRSTCCESSGGKKRTGLPNDRSRRVLQECTMEEEELCTDRSTCCTNPRRALGRSRRRSGRDCPTINQEGSYKNVPGKKKKCTRFPYLRPLRMRTSICRQCSRFPYLRRLRTNCWFAFLVLF